MPSISASWTLAVQILPARTDAGGAFDFGVDFRDREAAFVIDGYFLGRIEKFRIDEHPRLALVRPVAVLVALMRGADFGLGVLVLGLQVDHQQPQRRADLDRGEADAGGVVHRLEHVGGEGAQRVVKSFDGRGDLLEARIGDFDDR